MNSVKVRGRYTLFNVVIYPLIMHFSLFVIYSLIIHFSWFCHVFATNTFFMVVIRSLDVCVALYSVSIDFQPEPNTSVTSFEYIIITMILIIIIIVYYFYKY